MKKLTIDQYFFTETCPYTQKRKLKTKNVKTASIVIIVGLILGVLFFGENAENTSINVSRSDQHHLYIATTPAQSTEGSIQMGSSLVDLKAGSFEGANTGFRVGSTRLQRQYTSSQLVKNGTHSIGGLTLPMGTTFPAQIINTLLSSDPAQPVIAQINDSVFWRNSEFIPAGTQALGNASFNETSQRMQVRFHTLVYPSGDQHAISGLALLADGSSGIPGEYHSGELLKQTGRFAGNFVGGLADGIKDKQQAGWPGGSINVGSLKNGVLNGLTLSAMDQAKRLSEEAQQTKAYLEVSSGVVFYIYLEKEYQP